jgi:hypothetical protein
MVFKDRGGQRAHEGKLFFTCASWKDSIKMKRLANFNQICFKTFLHEGNLDLYK